MDQTKQVMKNCILHTLRFGSELIYLYGISVMMSGLFLGITGGYLGLFTMIAVSGAIFMGMFLNHFIHRYEENENSILFEACMQTALIAAITFLVDWKLSIVILAMSSVLIVFGAYTDSQKKRLILNGLFLLFWIVMSSLTVIAFSHGSIRFYFCIFLITAFSELLWNIREIVYHGEKETDNYLAMTMKTFMKPKKNTAILIALRALECVLIATEFAVFVPLTIQALHEGTDFQGTQYFIYSALVAVGLYLVHFIYEKKEEKIQGDLLYKRIHPIIYGILLACILIYFFMMSFSLTVGMITLFCVVACIAVFLIQKEMNQTEPEKLYNFRWAIIHILCCVVLVVSFTVYNSITLDTSAILMIYFLLYAMKYMTHIFEHIDVNTGEMLMEVVEDEE